jgi:vancomycin resistance protein YoaR
MYVGRHRASLGRRLWDLGGRRWVQMTGLALLGVVVVSGLLLVGARVLRGGSIPHVKVAGTEVGGMSEPELRTAIVGLERDYAAKTITFVRPAGAETPQLAVTAVAADLGYRIDVDATVDAVLHRGRQGNPIAALSDQVFSTFGTVDVQPVHDIDQARFDAWLSRTTANLSTFAQEGTILFDGATVTPVHPAAGAVVKMSDLQAQATAALEAMSTDTMYLPFTVQRPVTSADLVDSALGKANLAVSGSVTLTRGDGALTFTADEIGTALRTEPRRLDDGTIELAFVADAGRVAALAADEVDSVETDPEDATISVAGGGIKIVPGKKGFRFNAEKAATQLVAVATSPSRQAVLQGDEVAPDFTVEDAKALGIDERVAQFTTYYTCCQPRVTNIHRIADIIDGTIVKAGQTFSINSKVGERTVAKGFVEAPGITNGELVDQLGGGISQFATTMYNAIFFGGYDLLEYKAHSYYFTRYPAGREATVYWPSPDLAFKNDSKAAVYIDTSYTATSITVAFYGHQDLEVESLSSGGSNFTDPETQCKANPDIPAGQSTVTQEGSQGFDITVTRRFHYPNGSTKDEKFFTHYKPEPRIVEQQSCTEPSPEPTPSESPSPSPSGAPASGSAPSNAPTGGFPPGAAPIGLAAIAAGLLVPRLSRRIK